MTETSWHEELRARGYRVTPQRQLVLEAVTRPGARHPRGDLRPRSRQTARGVNISTVYRTLELLEQLGLVTHTHLGHGAPTYHLAAEADHVHLVCRDCGEITEVGPEAVAGLSPRWTSEHGFETDVRPPDRVRPLPRSAADGGSDSLGGMRSPLLDTARRRPRPRPPTPASPRTTATRSREQRALAARRAWSTGRNRGVVRITGPDRLTWLHSLTTQHLDDLAPGRPPQALHPQRRTGTSSTT